MGEKIFDNSGFELQYEIRGHVERGHIGVWKFTANSVRSV